MLKKTFATGNRVFVLCVVSLFAVLCAACKEKAKDLPLESENAAGYSKRAIAYNELSDSTRGRNDLGDHKYSLAREYESKREADFSRAIELEPQNAGLYRMRGDIYCGYDSQENKFASIWRDDFTKAIDDYSIVITLDPDDVETRHIRARAYLESKQNDKAVADFEAIIAMRPDRSSGYVNYAYANEYYIKDFPKAIGLYKQALKLEPSDEDAQAGLIRVQEKLTAEQERLAAEKRAKEREEYLAQFTSYTPQQLYEELTKGLETTRDQQNKLNNFFRKYILITGTVDNISNELGAVVVKFARSSDFNSFSGGTHSEINCYFYTRNAAPLDNVKKGQKITVLGKLDVPKMSLTLAFIGGTTWFPTGIDITDCSIP